MHSGVASAPERMYLVLLSPVSTSVQLGVPGHSLLREVTMPDIDLVTILVVEDDPGHARLIEMNLRRAGISNEILWFEDGQKVVDYLLEEERRGGSHWNQCNP